MSGKNWAISTVMCLLGSAVSAATVDVTYQVPGQSFGAENLQQTVTVSTPNDPNFRNGGLYDGAARAGMFQLNGGETLGDFAAFCVDLAQALQSGQTYTVASDLFTGRIRTNVERLFSLAYGDLTSSLAASAFQVALWEIVHDDGPSYDLSDGHVRISGNSAVTNQADSYLQGLEAAAASQYEIVFLSSAESQDVVLARLRSETEEDLLPVPIPATGALLLGGIGGLAALRRRRRLA